MFPVNVFFNISIKNINLEYKYANNILSLVSLLIIVSDNNENKDMYYHCHWLSLNIYTVLYQGTELNFSCLSVLVVVVFGDCHPLNTITLLNCPVNATQQLRNESKII